MGGATAASSAGVRAADVAAKLRARDSGPRSTSWSFPRVAEREAAVTEGVVEGGSEVCGCGGAGAKVEVDGVWREELEEDIRDSI